MCVCSADDLLCIVMEYCDGGDLLQRIRHQQTVQFGIEDVGLDYLKPFSQFCVTVWFPFSIQFH